MWCVYMCKCGEELEGEKAHGKRALRCLIAKSEHYSCACVRACVCVCVCVVLGTCCMRSVSAYNDTLIEGER